MKKWGVFISYFIMVYVCLSIVWANPFDGALNSSIGVFKNLILNPIKGLIYGLYLHFALPFLILIGFGAFFIFAFHKKLSLANWKKKAVLLFTCLFLLSAMGGILRLFVANKDYNGLLWHHLKTLAYGYLIPTSYVFYIVFLLPFSILIFLSPKWLQNKGSH